MKVRYKGGNVVEREVQVDPKNPKAGSKKIKSDELTQVLEEMEYHFPKPGAVLAVPSNVGGWLIGKCKPYLEEVSGEEEDETPKPRRLVAVVPADVKPPAAKPQ